MQENPSSLNVDCKLNYSTHSRSDLESDPHKDEILYLVESDNEDGENVVNIPNISLLKADSSIFVEQEFCHLVCVHEYFASPL